MLDWSINLLHGAALGFAVAAPIGPTGMLCVQRTVAGGMAPGLATGYGAATTHFLYALAAVAGMSVLASVVVNLGGLLQLLAGLFLLRMAILAIVRPPRLNAAAADRLSPRRAYLTGLALTLANPVTLLGFMTLTPAILERDALLTGAEAWIAWPLVAAGVLLGSATWWTALAICVACLRSQLGERGLRLANLVTGSVLACLAILLILRAANWK